MLSKRVCFEVGSPRMLFRGWGGGCHRTKGRSNNVTRLSISISCDERIYIYIYIHIHVYNTARVHTTESLLRKWLPTNAHRVVQMHSIVRIFSALHHPHWLFFTCLFHVLNSERRFIQVCSLGYTRSRRQVRIYPQFLSMFGFAAPERGVLALQSLWSSLV